MPLTLPPDYIIRAIHGSVTRVTQRVDIYESDGVTLWQANAKIISGAVTISASRDERRTCDLVLVNDNGDLSPRPGGFWYDKILKVFRGVYTKDSSWETQLGEFYIDKISRGSFPNTVNVSSRDATKLLLKAKFAASTEFPLNHPIEEIVRAIAQNGGITKFDLPLTGKSAGKAFMFERMTERWKAISEICTSYGYDVYFTPDGYLTMEEYKDPSNPAVSPSEYTFEIGGRDVRNGRIETLTDATTAAWWSKNYEPTGGGGVQSVETNTQHVRSGKYALKFANGANVGNFYASKSIKVEAGEVWEVSAFSKGVTDAGAVPAAGRYLRVLFGTSEGFARNAVGVTIADVGGANGAFTAEYAETKGTVTVPAGASWMRIAPGAWQVASPYTAWYDDIKARRLLPDPSLDTKGNLIRFDKVTADDRLYNHVVVTGERTDQVPVYAEAENTTATSPTRIAKIGRRTYNYTSSFITTIAQALEVAQRFLKIHALEQFDVSLEALVVPYLTVNIIVDFMDPEGTETDPSRFLLTDLTLPLDNRSMTGTAKRVTIVG